MPARLIIHFPYPSLVSCDGWLGILVGWPIFGQIEPILMIDHVHVEVATSLDHDVVQQGVGIREDDMPPLAIEMILVVVVEPTLMLIEMYEVRTFIYVNKNAQGRGQNGCIAHLIMRGFESSNTGKPT